MNEPVPPLETYFNYPEAQEVGVTATLQPQEIIQGEVDERVKLVESIKDLDQDQLTKLGFLMTTDEYEQLETN